MRAQAYISSLPSPRAVTTGWGRGAAAGVAVALCLTLGAAAWAQEVSTGSLRSGAGPGAVPSRDSGVPAGSGGYIPGMPAPPPEAGDAAATDGASAPQGGKIARVTKSNRAGDGVAVSETMAGQPATYRGIVPGVRDWHYFPRRAREAAKVNPKMKNRLTWIGYQESDKGGALFLQTIRPATYRVDEDTAADGSPRIVVTLMGTRVPLSNNRRSLDLRYFDSALEEARAQAAKENTIVTLTLAERAAYRVEQSGEFLFIHVAGKAQKSP